MPAELVDVVVGVDTHKHSPTAAEVSASTGGVLDEATVGPVCRHDPGTKPATAAFLRVHCC